MLGSGIFAFIRSKSLQTTRFYAKRHVKGDQSGIRRQVNVLGDVEPFMKDPEGGGFEADFTQLPKSHRQHERELETRKKRVKGFMIEKKYFKKEKQPNLLTWAEKEQIRHLNKQEPEDWTVERLAESYPATEEIIVKILKAKWTPHDLKQVQKHDERVKRSWTAFKANELKDLDPVLAEHLKKFSHRNFDSSQNAYVQTDNDQIEFKFPKPQKKEFLHLVTSCKAFAENKPKEIENQNNTQLESGNQHLTTTRLNVPVLEDKQESEMKIPSKFKNEMLTLEELKGKVRSWPKSEEPEEAHLSFGTEREQLQLRTGNVLEQDESNFTFDENRNDFEDIKFGRSGGKDVPDKLSENQEFKNELYPFANDTYEFSSPIDDAETINLTPMSSIQKYENRVAKVSNKNEVKLPSIRHKISIPQHLQKRGSTYRLYDCFYDDQGLFMYRVPGLTD